MHATARVVDSTSIPSLQMDLDRLFEICPSLKNLSSPKEETTFEQIADFILQMSRISRQSSIMTIQATTKIMFIVLVEQVVLDQKEPQLHYSQAIVLDKQGSSSRSFVKQINISTPNLLIWQDIVAVEAAALDMDTVVEVVAVEVVIPFEISC